MSMKRVIVSGAAGFIGNAVARQLINQGVSVLAVVKPGTSQNTEAFRLKDLEAVIVECDIKEIENLLQIVKTRGFDVFYQFAWDGIDRESFENYDRQIDGIKWMMKSIEVAKKLECKKFIGVGSVTQMEQMYEQGRRFTEDRHKFFRVAQFACETMGRAIAKEKGIQFIWPILINVYGEGEASDRLINSMIKNLLKGRHQSFSSGEQMYDFLHIQDAARAFCLIGEKGTEDTQYIIGSGAPRPLREYLLTVKNIVAPEMEIGLGELEFHGLEMRDEVFNIDNLVRDTGFIPNISFEEGIQRTLKWIVKGMNNE